VSYRVVPIGEVYFAEDGGFLCKATVPVCVGSKTKRLQVLEVLPGAYEWPGLGKYPAEPPYTRGKEWRAKYDEWRGACEVYVKALHADSAYRQAAQEFLELQRKEPRPVEFRDHLGRQLVDCWTYHDKLIEVIQKAPGGSLEDAVLLVKHCVLRQKRAYQKIRRQVEALENFEKIEGAARERIAESVRLFVWQRDGGCCVKCGSRERLEFDHIIPVAAGGSSTERNVQLLCESCNRSKGATV